MSHTNLSAAEIALLDSQLPDIGGAIRGKPVTPDGDGWRVGSGGGSTVAVIHRLHWDVDAPPSWISPGWRKFMRR